MRMGDYMEILNRNGLRASYADSWLVENAQAVQVMEQRIAELETKLSAMEENFQAVQRDRDELEQELLGLKYWKPA